MYCPECGKQNKENARFCRFCGTRIGENTGTDTTRFDFVKKRKWKIWMLIIAILLLLVAAGISIAFILKEQNAKQQIEGFLAEGNRYLEELDYEKAEDFYLRAIDIAPKEKEPYLRLAELYLEKGDIESARDIIRQAQDNVADSDKKEFESLEKDYENLETYTWVMEPKIEADDIYYPRDNDQYNYSVNELNRQKYSDYAVIKNGDKYGLIKNDGTIAAKTEYDDISVETVVILDYPDIFNPYMLTVQSEQAEAGIYYLDEESGVINDASNANGLDLGGNKGAFYFCGQLHSIMEGYDIASMGMAGETRMPVQNTIPVKQTDSLYGGPETIDGWNWYNELQSMYAIYSDRGLVTDFVYEECGSESSGLLAVKQDGKWGYVNESGAVVIPLEYDASWEQFMFDYSTAKDYCYAASDGYVALVKDGVWEMRDTEGNLVIAPGVFDEILPVYNDRCWVKKDGKWGVIEMESVQNTSDLAESILGTWQIDAEKTMEENGVSMIDIFGTSYKYGNEMKINKDGSFSYFIAAGIGGEGTWSMSDDQLTYDIITYEENANEKGTILVIKNDPLDLLLSTKVYGYTIFWEKEDENSNTESIFESMPSDFVFSSGAGAWSTELTLESDGSFTGYYHDSNMGDTGVGYEDGTVYICNFTGKFTTPEQINEYTYTMRLADIQIEGTPGEEYLDNDQRFIYSEPYGFDNAEEFFIYLPGAPISELPEGFTGWLRSSMNPDEEDILPCYGIYNAGGEEGFVAYESSQG